MIFAISQARQYLCTISQFKNKDNPTVVVCLSGVKLQIICMIIQSHAVISSLTSPNSCLCLKLQQQQVKTILF